MTVTLDILEFETMGKDEIEVVFEGEPGYVDEGIGSYEFWGQKCVDKQMVLKCEDISWDEKKYTPEENEIIEKYIEKAEEKLCEKYQPPEPDYEPEDYIEKRNWREEAIEQQKLK
jgi:hypothetical protein